MLFFQYNQQPVVRQTEEKVTPTWNNMYVKVINLNTLQYVYGINIFEQR